MFTVNFPDKQSPETFEALSSALGKAPENKQTKTDETVTLEEFHENQKNTHVQGGTEGNDSDED
jgi:hypothetical protein